MGTGTSLLLTLLTTDEANKCPVTLQDFADAGVDITTASNTGDAMKNVETVVHKIPPLPEGTPDLIKNVAQKKLYKVLYEIIEKEYGESDHGTETQADRDLNRKLNGAIGMAIEMAIRLASKAEKSEDVAKYESLITLRNALRREIFETLTPK